MRITILCSLLATFVLAGTTATAQDPQHKSSDLLVRIGAPLTLPAGDSAGTLVVIDGDALVRGRLKDNLVVLGGTARVSGTIDHDIAVAGGTLELDSTARVGGNVLLYRSVLHRAPGAVVAGKIDVKTSPAFGQWFAIGFWVSMTVTVLALGLLFAALAGKQLSEAASLLAQRPGASVISSLLTWGPAITIAILGFASVIGIPLGIVIMFFLLPALGFLGYLVAATALGAAISGRRNLPRATRPYKEAAIGVVALQVVGFIPAVGGLIVVLAGAFGAGALVYRSWSALRAHPVLTPAPGMV
jgi:hypothetical protein